MSKSAERLRLLRRKMEEEAVDLVALGPGAHLGWLIDAWPHADERPLLYCVTAERSGFLMPALEAESARNQTDEPFCEWADDEGPDGALNRLLDDPGAASARSVVLDETMRADHAALVQDTLLQARRHFSGATIGSLRMRKDGDEYAALKANALIADRAMQAGWAARGRA